MRLSQLIQFVPRTLTESADDDFKSFYLIPDKTEPEYRYGKQERVSLIPKNYPNIKATRNWNNSQRNKERILLTKTFFNKIQILSNSKLNPSHKESLRKKFIIELQSLRPHPTDIAERYKKLGEPESNICLLLNNYELLPDIKLTKDQFIFLENVLNKK
jgi:hypothetical protein